MELSRVITVGDLFDEIFDEGNTTIKLTLPPEVSKLDDLGMVRALVRYTLEHAERVSKEAALSVMRAQQATKRARAEEATHRRRVKALERVVADHPDGAELLAKADAVFDSVWDREDDLPF